MWKIKNSAAHYGAVAKGFHWAMAVLILGMLAMGLYMADLPLGLQKLTYYGWHKEWGVVVLIFALLRLGWKITQMSPTLPSSLGRLSVCAAKAGHALLYGMMLAMPISGWLMSSAAGFPVSVFGWFTLPVLMAPDDSARKILAEVHEYLAFGLMALIAGHILAALMHHYLYKDNVLRRMLPW